MEGIAGWCHEDGKERIKGIWKKRISLCGSGLKEKFHAGVMRKERKG
jgi:hypothetical protein